VRKVGESPFRGREGQSPRSPLKQGTRAAARPFRPKAAARRIVTGTAETRHGVPWSGGASRCGV